MGKNGYFRLINEANKTSLKLIPPEQGGKAIDINDVMEYLSMKDYACDLPTLKKAVDFSAAKEVVIPIGVGTRLAERECYKMTVSPDNMTVSVKYYAASVGGEDMTEQEMLRDLSMKGITVGIKQDVIHEYFTNRNYLEEIVIAEGIAPVQGQDAYIEYFFNTDKGARPSVNEDGSVDFFHLNIVQRCNEGDTLAALHREVPGTPGSDVFGAAIKPVDVKKKVLKYGRNIEITEDDTVLKSLVSGHVELVDDKVFVSNVLEVENVDNSTGNIDYEGSVQINGNVCTNFTVRAEGDINVKGVVEGAELIAGGNIIIVRGMNGMARGKLTAKGNIIAKFLENATASADGYVSAESIIHSHVMAGDDVTVDGKRGFIVGGKVTAGKTVHVKTLGTSMGADTVVEVGTDPKIKEQLVETQKAIMEDMKALQQIQPVLMSTKQKIAQGAKFTPEQLKYVQSLAEANKQKSEAIEANTKLLDELQKQATNMDGVMVAVKGEAHPGSKICIGEVSVVLQKTAHYCRYVKERGEVVSKPY